MTKASLKEEAPTGRIMNSWQARRLPAWLPPLMTLKEGTGIMYLSVGRPAMLAMYSYNGICMEAAPARQRAMDTAKIALAPNEDLDQPQSFWVPSRISTIRLSISFCRVTSMPTSFGAILSLTFCTAFWTPLPRRRPLSPSRSSQASWMPVEAPEGTAARTEMPDSVVRSTSTVGLPRLSKISRPLMVLILNLPASTAAMASSKLPLPEALSAATLIMASMGRDENAR
mmetsp:Transcript_49945/g.138725  ORF Transcript_49945/g.138725 Transcript_49945/m.138725 type:complete len:228 (+) Transcript_49945:58-741(+)